MEVFFAPDTNFFLQCRDAVEISWAEVTSAESISLVILSEVAREMDRLKAGGNTRRAKRARKLNSLLRSLILGQESELILREGSPRVSMQFAPRLESTDLAKDSLSTSPDERIVSEALACSHIHFNGQLVLLSDDAMPLHLAKQAGLKFCAVPETWLLPPEPSEHERQIRELKERVSQLEGKAPVIELGAISEGDAQERITGTLLFYPPLNDQFVNAAVDVLVEHLPLRNWPAKTSPRLGDALINALRPPDDAISNYEASYAEWKARIRSYLERLASFHNRTAPPFRATLNLANNGSSAADGLVVDIVTQGNVRLYDPDEEEVEIPPPPRQPSGPSFFAGIASPYGSSGMLDPSIGMRDPFSAMKFPVPRMARNRHEFYWDYDKPLRASEHCRGVCEDFRHGLQNELISLLLRWAEPSPTALRGAIKVIISARNLPSPILATFPVSINVDVGDTESLARSVLSEAFGIEV